MGGPGEEWRRLPPRDTLSSLLLPPPSQGGGVLALKGLAGRAETTSPSNRSREFLGTRRHVKIQKPWPSRGSLGNLRVSSKKKRTDIPSSPPALAQPLSTPPPGIHFSFLFLLLLIFLIIIYIFFFLSEERHRGVTGGRCSGVGTKRFD